MKGKRVALIGGGIVLAYLVFRWYRNRTAANAQTGSQTLVSIPGGNVPVMSGGGGTTVNPTATVTAPSSQVTTFSTVQHSASGDPTGSPGAPNVQRVSSQSQLDVSGGWGVNWSGAGIYEARKFNATVPGGGSNTLWVKVG